MRVVTYVLPDLQARKAWLIISQKLPWDLRRLVAGYIQQTYIVCLSCGKSIPQEYAYSQYHCSLRCDRTSCRKCGWSRRLHNITTKELRCHRCY